MDESYIKTAQSATRPQELAGASGSKPAPTVHRQNPEAQEVID